MDNRFGIPLRESESVEFKESLSELSRGIKSGCAMLNGSSGGSVYFGVRDDGTVVGLEPGSRLHDKLSTELSKLSPQITPETISHQLSSGRIVLEIRIPGNLGPFRYQGKAYSRIDASDHEMSEEEYHRRLIERHHSSSRWETYPSELELDEIDVDTLLLMIDEAIRTNRMSDPGHRNPERLLQGLGLMRNNQIVRGAALLFGNQDALRIHLPQSRLRLARFNGVTKERFIDNRQHTGNLFHLLRLAQNFLTEYNPVRSDVVPHTLTRRDQPLYHPEAIREALVNAFAHRDYAEPGGAVDIAIYDDRLEIVSTGGLRFGLRVRDLLRDHQSRAWNPLIADVLQLYGVFENWGRGTLRILELCRMSGLPDPIFEDFRHSFSVRFSRSTLIHNDAMAANHPLHERVISALSFHGSLSLAQLEDVLIWTDSRRTLQAELQRLRSAGLITLEGQRRWARWKLSEPI